MKKIPLTQGKFAIVDDKDYDWLSQWEWFYHRGYAIRTLSAWRGGGTFRMHRVILNTPKGLDTDHINNNGLDNRRTNLRVCSHAQNLRNQGKQKSNKSGYKGVSWDKATKKWHSQLHINGKTKHLGRHFCLIRAARAYDKAAKKYFKEFANLNFKEES